jgi:fructose-1,6-bisphosphatase II
MLVRAWPRDDAERDRLRAELGEAEPSSVFGVDDLVQGESAIFCATGISDSSLLPGVKLKGPTAITHSILMRARSRTIRYIQAVHDLRQKTIHLRSLHGDRKL